MAPPELEDGPVLSSPAPLACFIKCGPCLDPHVFPPCHQAHPKPALCLLGGLSLGPFSPASGSHGLTFAGAASWPPSPSSALLSSKPRCAEHPAPPLRESVLAASLSWVGLARVTVTLGSATAASRITRQPPASLGPSRASLSYPRSLNSQQSLHLLRGPPSHPVPPLGLGVTATRKPSLAPRVRAPIPPRSPSASSLAVPSAHVTLCRNPLCKADESPRAGDGVPLQPPPSSLAGGCSPSLGRSAHESAR